MTHPTLERALRLVVAERSAWLEREFGFAALDVDVEAEPTSHTVHVSGTVVGWHEADRLAAALRQAIPNGWRLDDSGLHQRRTGVWRALPAAPTWLWRELPTSERSVTPASEVLPEDGPVEVLATVGAADLVRTETRLMGWTTAELGAVTSAPAPIAADPGPAPEVAEVALGFVGIPYRLGGTSAAGMDCSGLVFRTIRKSLDRSIHRHSLDQVDRGTVDVDRLHRGDLVLVYPEGKLPHIGIVTSPGGDDSTVVHASAVRREVVVEPLAEFLDGHPLTAAGAPRLG